MTLQDAKAILTGGEDSVTQYFRRTSSEALTKIFPIVKATGACNWPTSTASLPARRPGPGRIDQKDADLDAYVTQKAIDAVPDDCRGRGSGCAATCWKLAAAC